MFYDAAAAVRIFIVYFIIVSISLPILRICTTKQRVNIIRNNASVIIMYLFNSIYFRTSNSVQGFKRGRQS